MGFLYQLKEERLKERLRNRLNKLKNQSPGEDGNVPTTTDLVNESIAEYEDLDDKSFDELASFTSDVTDKVGNVANEASTGVTVSLLYLSFPCYLSFVDVIDMLSFHS